MRFGDNHVISPVATIIWDAITRPNLDEAKGTTKWALKLVFPPGCQDHQDLVDLVQRELTQGMWKGILPPKGMLPLGTTAPGEFNNLFPDWVLINPKTSQGAPEVRDTAGALLSAMTYGSMLYPGAKVKVLVHAFSYDQINKGVGLGLDGIQIIDATVPKLAIGSGGVDVAAAFGGPPGAPPPSSDGPPAGYKMTAKAGASTYKTFTDAKWTKEAMLTEGYLEVIPATDFLAGPPPPPGASGPPPPPGASAPAEPVMTNKAAGTTYQQFRDAKWSHQQLIDGGYILPCDEPVTF